MKIDEHPEARPSQPRRSGCFSQLHVKWERYQHRLADYLTIRFQRLSIKTRRTFLIAAGLLLALLCAKTILAPGEFNFSDGSINRPVRSSTPADSTHKSITPDSATNR